MSKENYSWHKVTRFGIESNLKLEGRQLINKFKADFRRDGGFNNPIIVNHRTMCVIDGQYRLIAFKEVLEEDGEIDDRMIAVRYVNVPEDEEECLRVAVNELLEEGEASFDEILRWINNKYK